jgi:peptide/nickel transport system permease protein
MNINARWKTLALLALAGIHLAIFFPGFFAPYDFAEQHRDFPFAPPTRFHFVDAAGKAHLWPFVYRLQSSEEAADSYSEDRAQAYPIRLFASGATYQVLGMWTMRRHLLGVDSPCQLFLFGTDDFGRDELSRMLYGGRISLIAGMLAAVAALTTGTALGLFSGFYGGWFDAAVMRFAELFLALPWLYLLFAIRAILPLSVNTTDAFLLLVGVVGIVGWARPARLVRGIVLSAKEKHFVLAAKAMGASDTHLLRRHILPETYGVLLTTAALLVPQFILAEVTLSFLGLGVGEPTPSWGNLLAELQHYSVLTSYWWMYLPAIALVVLFLLYHSVASAFQKKVAEVHA